MPRKPKNQEGGEGAPAPKPRVRKKKEAAPQIGTPSGDGMKLEPGNPMGFDQMGGMPHPGLPPGMQHNGGPPGGPGLPPGMLGPGMSDDNIGGMGHMGPGPGGMPPGAMPPYGMPGPPMPGPGAQLQMPQHPQQFAEPEPPPGSMPGGPPPFMFGQGLPPPHGPPPPGPPPPHPMSRSIQMTPYGPNFPQPPFLEFRVQEMNRRLYSFQQTTSSQADFLSQWWEAFAHEFFDDDARMTISMFDMTEMMPRKFTIGRLLIPRFYRKIFESGVREMYYLIRMPVQERFNPQQWGMSALDCENVLMVTCHDRPVQSEVHTDCSLFIEFAPYNENVGYRIRHWSMEMRNSQELYRLPRDGLNNTQQEFVKTGVAKSGLPQPVLHYLKMCLILEPMQILMHQSKIQNTSPNASLKSVLFNHYKSSFKSNNNQPGQLDPMPGGLLNQPSLSVPSTPTESEPTTKKPARKRQRKTTTNSNASNATTNPSPKKKGGANAANAMQSAAATPPPPQNIPPNFQPNPAGMFNPMMFQDQVLVVGEPSMMGCEFGEDDERAISRIENAQYDPSSSVSNSLHNAALISTSMGGQQPHPSVQQQLMSVHCTSSGAPQLIMSSQLINPHAGAQLPPSTSHQQQLPPGMGGPPQQPTPSDMPPSQPMFMTDFDAAMAAQSALANVSWSASGPMPAGTPTN
ncbi:LIM-domain binding protein [Ditylenchus destructor]|nr:LIM-domain binding protein [Ditylenchus destructor]